MSPAHVALMLACLACFKDRLSLWPNECQRCVVITKGGAFMSPRLILVEGGFFGSPFSSLLIEPSKLTDSCEATFCMISVATRFEAPGPGWARHVSRHPSCGELSVVSWISFFAVLLACVHEAKGMIGFPSGHHILQSQPSTAWGESVRANVDAKSTKKPLRSIDPSGLIGGGGNRTPVLWTLNQSFYAYSSLIRFATTRFIEQNLPSLDHNKSRTRRSDQ